MRKYLQSEKEKITGTQSTTVMAVMKSALEFHEEFDEEWEEYGRGEGFTK